MVMTEKEYKEYWKLFVNLNEVDYMRVAAPCSKDDNDFIVNIIRKMKNYEKKHGKPGNWIHKYNDYMNSAYRLFTLAGEHSKEGFLWDRV